MKQILFKAHWLAIFIALYSYSALAQKSREYPPPLGIPPGVHAVGQAMDRLARQAEEWGTIHMSAPLLVEPGEDFRFDLKRGTSNYFAEAKSSIQGASAYGEQVLQSFSAALKAQYDPTMAAAYTEQLRRYHSAISRVEEREKLLGMVDQLQFMDAYQAAVQETNPAIRATLLANLRGSLQTSLTNPTPSYPQLAPEGSNAPTGGSILGTNRPAQSLFNSTGFQPYFGLFPPLATNQIQLNNRAALNIAAGDQTTEAIFRLLGNPERAADFAGRKVLMGVATIAVNPGYRTRNDYAADLGVLPQFSYRPARLEVVNRLITEAKLPAKLLDDIRKSYDLTGSNTPAIQKTADPIPDALFDDTAPTPLAMAVSPLAEMDVLDEASSLRRQTEFALSLSFILRQAGLVGQAEAMEQYVKRREQDSRSRTPVAAINTYSGAGGLFGWQVGPRFRAVKDPGSRKQGGPANVLERQTFPALVLIGYNQEDLYPRLRQEKDGRITVLEPYLSFTQIPRWLPLKNGWLQERLSETERLEASARVARVGNQLNAIAATNNPQGGTNFGGMVKLAEARLRALKFQAFGGENGQNFDPRKVVPLPDRTSPKPLVLPQISAIFPPAITLLQSGKDVKAQAADFVILGSQLNQIDIKRVRVLSGPTDFQSAQITHADNAILLKNVLLTNGGALIFSLPLKAMETIANSADVALPSPPVLIKTVTIDPPKPESPVPTRLTATQEPMPSSTNGIRFSVEISPQAPSENVKAAQAILEAQINKNKP